MPIYEDYAPVEYVPGPDNVDRKFRFGFPYIEESSIEVYEIIDVDGTEYRYLVPVTDYYIEPIHKRPKYPVVDAGRVVLTRNYSVGMTKIRIERNTYMDQTVVIPLHAHRFNGRIIGAMLDKATMICQEINDRKCDVTVTTPITQLMEIHAYDDYRAPMIDQAIAKLYTIMQEIRDTGEDCKGREDDT